MPSWKRQAILVLVLSACSSSPSTSVAPSTSGASTSTEQAAVTSTSAAPDSVEVPDQYLDASGAFTFEGAKALFAATFAPLPGVTAAASPTSEDTGVLNVLIAHRADLTVDQQAVLDRIIGGPGTPYTQLLGANGGAVRRRPRIDLVDTAAHIVGEAVAMWEAKLGRTLSGGREMITLVSLPMFNADGSANFGGPANGASAIQLLDAGTLVYNECRIRLNADAAYQDALFRGQVSHEVFHCFQYDITGTDALPRWIVEGSAAYAGELFAGGTSYAQGWYGRWINEPERPLARRSYDGIALFGAVQAIGVDPFTTFDALLRVPTIDTLYAATGANLRNVWGAGLANEPGWGVVFTLNGPGAIATKAQRFPVHLLVDGDAGQFNTFAPDTLTAQAYELFGAGDVIVVQSTGYGAIRFDDGTHAVFDGGIDQSFCVRPGGCACPNGATSRQLTNVNGDHAFVGVGPGSLPRVVAQSMETWCLEDGSATTVPMEASGCVVGSWTSAGIAIPSLPSGLTITSAGKAIANFHEGGAFDGTISGIAIDGTLGGTPVHGEIAGQFAGAWSTSGTTLNITSDGNLIETVIIAGQTQTIDLSSMLGDGQSIFGSGQYSVSCSASTLVVTVSGGVEITRLTRL